MTWTALDNLVKTGGLKQEPPDQQEFDGMVQAARRRLQDAHISGLSGLSIETLTFVSYE
ncbi:hypothetical protein SAMN05877962_106140 [Alloalcanivorax xenomutans]|uniref:hypothetical protein n=1 Tax=Alloalcanivorax xenomutans TaxID=1094342 RepID=UPI000BD361A2|nr:hypothetical protein [Alloalcanivorax xenomutans]SOC04513.1 hypothetical protein SAMN05877962_106140 [Alloalcanivorax xenomutans]